jgi:hypothetical protein
LPFLGFLNKSVVVDGELLNGLTRVRKLVSLSDSFKMFPALVESYAVKSLELFLSSLFLLLGMEFMG